MAAKFPQFNSVTTYIHRVDADSKTIFASFSSEKSKQSAGSKPPIAIPMGDMPKNKEDAKEWLSHFGVGVLMAEQGTEDVNGEDISYWQGMATKSYTSTKTSEQLLAQFFNSSLLL
jgi:hypothetical protein